jgi:hypothetical protein
MADLPSVPPRFREFYEWIGHCITAWSSVDVRLFEITHLVMECGYEHVAIVYYRTPSLEAGISLANEIVRSSLPPREPPNGGHVHPLVKEWDAIIKDIRELMPQRNIIAHSPVREHRRTTFGNVASEAEFGQIEEVWIESYPVHHEMARPETKERSMKRDDLPVHYRAVNTLCERLKTFQTKIRKARP